MSADDPSIGVDDTTLVEDDCKDIMTELKNVLARHHEIGSRLHLKDDQLNVIDQRNPVGARAMKAVIIEWLKKNYNTTRFGPPTWKALVVAVANPLGGNNKAEAERIAGRHKAATLGSTGTHRTRSPPSDPAGGNNRAETEEIGSRYRAKTRPPPTISSVMSFLNQEGFSPSRVGEFGLFLNVPKSKLNTFEINHPRNANRVLMDVIEYWLDNDLSFSWDKLADALEKCDYAVSANKIRTVKKITSQDDNPDEESEIKTPPVGSWNEVWKTIVLFCFFHKGKIGIAVIVGLLACGLHFYLPLQVRSGSGSSLTEQPHATLTKADHSKVTRFLTDLTNEQLVDLGAELGLWYPHLQRMKTLPGDMVAAWLQMEDNITQSPSWNTLAAALEAIHQKGIASTIRKAFNL